MKNVKKILAVLMALALVITTTVAVTLAYLSDKTKVAKNTFTLGKVDIILDEAVVDEDGKAKTPEERTQEGNTTTYDGSYGYNLLPGKLVDKDPTVTVIKGSEDAYVRVKVTLNNASKFIAIYKAHNAEATNDVEAAIAYLKDCFVGYDETVWKYADAKMENDAVTVTFNYKEKVTKNTAADTKLEPIIKKVKLPDWVTSEMAAQFTNGFEVTIVAEAIQAEGFADEAAAWAAFDAQTNPVSGQGA